MKLKFTYFITSLIITISMNSLVNGQTVWLNKQDVWTFHTMGGWTGEGISRITVGKDTTIANIVYSQMIQNTEFLSGASSTQVCYLRQSGSKIYCYPNFQFGNPSEFLMYDFDKLEGDTVFLPIYGELGTGYGYVISGITSINISGQIRKVQNVKWLNPGVSLSDVQKSSFIDGIGNVVGLHLIGGADCQSDSYLYLDQPSASVVDGDENSFCNFTSSWGSYDGVFSSLCSKITSSTEVIGHNLKVYPNPSNGEIQIFSKFIDGPIEIQLYDLTGRLIQSTKLGNSRTFSTNYKGQVIILCRSTEGLEYAKVVFE